MTAEYPRYLSKGLTVFALRSVLVLSPALCLTLSAAPATAQSASDSATAQALFDHAKKLMQDGKYPEACSALEESQRIEARSGTALNLADCYEHTGRLASAWSTFLEAATLAKATGNAERERGARERAAALAARLSNLVINAPFAASTPGLEITRDGQLVGAAQWGLPLPADAGTHTIAAKAPGRTPWQSEVAVPGDAKTTDVTVPDLPSDTAVAPAAAAGLPSATAVALAPAAPAAATAPAAAVAQPTRSEPTDAASAHAAKHVNGSAIALGAVTGALLVGTIVTGVLYRQKLDDYNTANDQLLPNRSELHTQVKTLGVANLALLGATVVSAGLTVFLWTRAPSRQAPTSASASLQLRGLVGPTFSGLALGGTL